MKEKYLPIGSVVIMKDAKKKVMITGFLAMGKESPDKTYDYMGCLFPEGVLSSEQNLLFNHDQIEQVFYEGYVDEEQKSFMEKLKTALASIENAKKLKDETAPSNEKVDSLEDVKPIPLGESEKAPSYVSPTADTTSNSSISIFN